MVQAATQQTTSSLIDILVKQGLLSDNKAQEVIAESQKSGKTIEAVLSKRKLVREEDLARAKGTLYNVPFIDLFGRIVRAEILNIIPQELANNYKIVAFSKTGNEVSVAMVDPADFKAIEAIEFIARKNRFKIKYYITSLASLKYILRQYESLSAEVEEALKGAATEIKAVPEKIKISGEGVEEVTRQAPVSKMVSVILKHAVEGKASDVHIEPVGGETRVRYRIDGILHTSLILPKYVHSSIVARIKVLSNMKIDETRIPQDGRFRMTIEGKDIDYRVSTLPLINNEKVVMRILDTATSLLELQELGFVGRNQEIMRRSIRKSYGMFLITGPTGSGKSTTLYALLNILNQESVNIVTLEDPVEYYMEGINQSQVNPEVGLTFAAGLRSILRQDPDIVMVGEIRDNETAELATHASLTGHIVLSTLHTNDAFGAIPRLIDMGIEPFLITASLNLVMAQRLVRRVCPHCKEAVTLPETLMKEVTAELEKIPKSSLPEDLKTGSKITFYRGRGCVRCENTGYKGRIAIGEVLSMTPQLQKIIVAKGEMIEKIKQEFIRQGMFSMKQDGIVKAIQGITTIEEVLRATKI